MISLTAVIPTILSRNHSNKFTGQAKVAVNSLEGTGTRRGSSSVRPPGWWGLAESGALVLGWGCTGAHLYQCAHLAQIMSCFAQTCHVLPKSCHVPSHVTRSQFLKCRYHFIHIPWAYCPGLLPLGLKGVVTGYVREKVKINISWLNIDTYTGPHRLATFMAIILVNVCVRYKLLSLLQRWGNWGPWS